MHITGFIWHEDVIDKLIWKHQVETDEVAEIFQNRPRFERVQRDHQPNEHLYVASGQTDEGRYLNCSLSSKSSNLMDAH